MSELIVNVINGFNLGWLGWCEFVVYGGIIYDELVVLIECEVVEFGFKVVVW